VVNLGELDRLGVPEPGSDVGEGSADAAPGVDAAPLVTPELLASAGLVRRGSLVKVLGRGELHKALTVRAHAFSGSAKRSIEAAGGATEVLPPPFGNGRPAARGSALTNR
jgi:hypothetical protein